MPARGYRDRPAAVLPYEESPLSPDRNVSRRTAALALVVVAAAGCAAGDEAARPAGPPAAGAVPTSASPASPTPASAAPTSAAPTSAAPDPAAPGPEAGHEDDPDAPVEELVDHADHLDLGLLTPGKRRAVEAELARRQQVGGGLWEVYGARLGAPLRVRALAAQELGFVLLAGRADQLASAVAQAGDLTAARALPDVGPDHEDVTARLRGRCVSVSWSGDEFDRSFGVRVSPGTAGPLAERLRRVRVAGPGTSPCRGAPLALSPSAQSALG